MRNYNMVDTDHVNLADTINRVSSLIKDNPIVLTPSKKRKADTDLLPGIQSLNEQQQQQSMYPPLPASDQSLAWSTVVRQQGRHQVPQQGVGQQPGKGQTPRGQQRGAWKRSLNILHGTADSGNTLAADVSLVAYGVAKDASAEQLKSFLERKNIQVLECINLTTYDQARTH